MKVGTIIFLKVSVFIIGIITLCMCIFALPSLAEYSAKMNPEYAFLKFPVLIGIYTTAIPFLFSLFQAFKLLNYIKNENIFSELAVKSLSQIKNGAITIIFLYVIGMLLLALLNALHPGIAIIGIVIVFATLVIAVFTAVLQELLKGAIKIKSENDLTVWGDRMAIIINVDVMLAKRKMTVTELSEKVGITMANISILKNGKAKAIRFSTLESICKALDCQPGDILEYKDEATK